MRGARRASTFSTSRTAAPVGEVITPTAPGATGSARLPSAANQPRASSSRFSASKAACRRPAPAGSMCSTISWKSPRAAYSPVRPRTSTAPPFSGRKATWRLRPRNIAQRTCAPLSFSEKYRWPLAGRERFDSSPSSHSVPNPVSRCRATSCTSRLTV